MTPAQIRKAQAEGGRSTKGKPRKHSHEAHEHFKLMHRLIRWAKKYNSDTLRLLK